MLEDLTIKDFALIEYDYLEFKNGFTVLSGETGAGKSILIGALSFLLGGKADTTLIRAGKSEASVSATFLLNNQYDSKPLKEDEEPVNPLQWLEVHGTEAENNRVVLRRFIRENGKSGAWINDIPVTRAELVQFSSFLIDIHGQHEHQSLMKVSEHRKFLDSRAGIVTEVEDFKKLYSLLVMKREELSANSMSENERLRQLDMMRFALKEISDAKLKQDEDLELEEEESRLSSYEKLYSTIEELNGYLSGSEDSVSGLMKKIRRNSSSAVEMDKSLSKLDERIEASFYEINDLSDEFSSYLNGLVFDPARLEEVQNRLSLIYNLKKKYASSVNASLSEVFDYEKKAVLFIEENEEGDTKRERLAEEIKKIEKELLVRAENISEKRKACAAILTKEVDAILSNLGMSGTTFGVSIKDKAGSEIEQKCGPYGKDDIEFLISANPGNPLLPLAKIASGGELSRVMLALKTIFAKNDEVESLIFDEIDTGIGGEVAVAVGNHIKKLSQYKQIFCITHLASIAVYADNQIKIEKSVSGGITASNVREIQGEERVSEIARMLSGDSYSTESLEHARTMLNKYSGGI